MVKLIIKLDWKILGTFGANTFDINNVILVNGRKFRVNSIQYERDVSQIATVYIGAFAEDGRP